MDEGSFLKRDLTSDLQEAKAQVDAHEAKVNKDYIRDRKRKDATVQPPGPVTFAGKLLWLDEGVSRLDIGGAAVARRLQFQIVSSPVGCDVCVSSNPSKPQSLPALWDLSLRGGYCCTPSFLLHGVAEHVVAYVFVVACSAASVAYWLWSMKLLPHRLAAEPILASIAAFAR